MRGGEKNVILEVDEDLIKVESFREIFNGVC